MRLHLVRLLFLVYRGAISPLIHFLTGPGFGCRFEPTCSRYGEQAIRERGLLRGGALAINRVCRCHPFTKQAGFDPVPQYSIVSSRTRKVSANGS